jgi:hypothetical protein
MFWKLDTLKTTTKKHWKVRSEVMEKISWTDRVKNELVLQRVEEERNIVYKTKQRNVNWIGHILRKNCLPIHVIQINIEGRMSVTGRRRRRRKELLNDLKEGRGYCKLKEEVLERTVWRTCFGRGYELVRQHAWWWFRYMHHWLLAYT